MNPSVSLLEFVGLSDPNRTLATIALNVADSGILAPATRVFLKDQVYPRMESKAIRERLRRFVQDELRPEADGVFIIAGSGVWEVVELGVPLDNLVRLGPAPYLPPLVEAMQLWPRVHVVDYAERGGRIQEFHLGRWSEVDQVRSSGMDAVQQDPERLRTGRPIVTSAGPRLGGTGIGGGKRDRFKQGVQSATAGMLADVARRVAALQRKRPAAWIFAFGDRERLNVFRDRLPAELVSRLKHLGPVPRRDDLRLRRAVRREVQRLREEELQAETREFLDRRRRGREVALGPGDVLAHAERGRLARVFVDAADPVEGIRCPSCGRRADASRTLCEACGERVVTVSLTQELVARSLTHPPLPITFVRKRSRWLRECGGVAALLSTKGMKRKRA